jgi:hypothetical protein
MDVKLLEQFDSLKDNPFVWGKIYLGEHFRMKSPAFHAQILFEVYKSTFAAVASPRESAKSTIVAFLIPIHAICFKRKRFILIVSNTYSKAAGTLTTIKKEIKDNQQVKDDFPIEIVKDAEGDSVFRHRDGFETRVLCKGAEQIGSVRGEKYGAYRPDLILIDDLEDDELVRSGERRRNLKDLYDEALVPAGEKGRVQIMAIGTILHDDSLMAKLVSTSEYTEYNKLFFKALNKINGDLVFLWPHNWTVVC